MGARLQLKRGECSNNFRMSWWLNATLAVMGVVATSAGCGDTSNPGGAAEGGSTGSGGVRAGSGGANGGRSSGGSSSAGGSTARGGAPSGGATDASGGVSEAGGNAGSGGFPEGGSAGLAQGGAAGAFGGLGTCNPALGSEQAGSDMGAVGDVTCGQPGEVIAAGTRFDSTSTVPVPELEPLRGCKHFRGTLQLAGLDQPLALEALADLEEIDGSLLVSASELGGLSRLRRVGGNFIAYAVFDTPSRLDALESVGGLWLYEGSFETLEWLPKLARIESSFIARRNLVAHASLEAFAAERVVCGAHVSLSDSVPPESPSAEANQVLCGEPGVNISATDLSLVGCTRLLGSIHLPDIGSSEQIKNLSSLIQIDGSLTLFRNHITDFSALGNLRRVGAKFQPHAMNGPTLKGFEKLEEVGELNITAPWSELSDFDWLPALTKVRESAFVERGATPPEAAVTALISRLEVGGEIVLRSR